MIPMVSLSEQIEDTIPEQSAKATWAINEITNTGIDPQSVKKVVDITFPCKIVYQKFDGEVVVLNAKSATSHDVCSGINGVNPIRTKEDKKNTFLAAQIVIMLTLIVYFTYRIKRKNNPEK